jgi:Fis family transcriptional regulator
MPATMHYVKPSSKVKKPVLKEAVGVLLNEYFDSLKGEKIEHVYNLVLTEIEYPLLQAVMKFCNNNQSQAAATLGINRGTFRKKLAFYGML